MESNDYISYNIINRSYGNIKFYSFVVDNDFLGWKYKFPDNSDDKIVVINYCTLYNPSTKSYVTSTPTFGLSNWKDFIELTENYFSHILVFPKDTPLNGIFYCLKKFMVSMFSKKEETKYIAEKLNKFYKFNKGSTFETNKLLYFDYETKKILNKINL